MWFAYTYHCEQVATRAQSGIIKTLDRIELSYPHYNGGSTLTNNLWNLKKVNREPIWSPGSQYGPAKNIYIYI